MLLLWPVSSDCDVTEHRVEKKNAQLASASPIPPRPSTSLQSELTFRTDDFWKTHFPYMFVYRAENSISQIKHYFANLQKRRYTFVFFTHIPLRKPWESLPSSCRCRKQQCRRKGSRIFHDCKIRKVREKSGKDDQAQGNRICEVTVERGAG